MSVGSSADGGGWAALRSWLRSGETLQKGRGKSGYFQVSLQLCGWDLRGGCSGAPALAWLLWCVAWALQPLFLKEAWSDRQRMTYGGSEAVIVFVQERLSSCASWSWCRTELLLLASSLLVLSRPAVQLSCLRFGPGLTLSLSFVALDLLLRGAGTATSSLPWSSFVYNVGQCKGRVLWLGASWLSFGQSKRLSGPQSSSCSRDLGLKLG